MVLCEGDSCHCAIYVAVAIQGQDHYVGLFMQREEGST